RSAGAGRVGAARRDFRVVAAHAAVGRRVPHRLGGGEAHGLSFTALRDPMSDAAYAASVAQEAGMPASALRPFASVELSLRQATLHAPALLVFAHGRFSGL